MNPYRTPPFTQWATNRRLNRQTRSGETLSRSTVISSNYSQTGGTRPPPQHSPMPFRHYRSEPGKGCGCPDRRSGGGRHPEAQTTFRRTCSTYLFNAPDDQFDVPVRRTRRRPRRIRALHLMPERSLLLLWEGWRPSNRYIQAQYPDDHTLQVWSTFPHQFC